MVAKQKHELHEKVAQWYIDMYREENEENTLLNILTVL
jgi:hypothetical protein